MRRDEAIEYVCKKAHANSAFIFANGKIAREGYLKSDSKKNFYMLSSMGKASSIGLGIALCNPETFIYIFDGDGNILMNLDNLSLIGSLQPKKFIHIVLDNQIYATTGGQRSISDTIDLSKVAESCKYNVFYVTNLDDLDAALKKSTTTIGPHFILIMIDKEEIEGTKIIPYTPEQIRYNFMIALRSIYAQN